MELGQRHDVVVIGSGAGGAAAAWRLCQHGLKVLMLEAGPGFDPVTDYPLDKTGWERRGFPAKPGSQGQVSYGDLGLFEAENEDLRAWSRGGYPWRAPSGQPRPASVSGYSHVMGVGGSTLHYVGESHRLHPDAFNTFSKTGEGVDWPVGYAALEPYYTLVEKVLGVAGDDGDGARWRSAPYPLPAHPLSPGAQALIAAGKRIGQGWGVNPRAALSAAYDDRTACNYCGQCSRGCPLGDKGSTDVTFLRQALGTGNLQLLSEATVIRLITGPNGRIVQLELHHAGQTHLVETPVVVLAGGAIQTPRLLLLSADPEHPDGLANASGQVGRNFMETLNWVSAGLVSDMRNSHMGLPADAIWWGPGIEAGFRLNHTTLETGLNGPIGYGTRLIAGFGSGFKQAMRAGFGQALAVGGIGRVVPDERSRVTLDPELRDVHGLALPRISSVLTPASLQRLRHMANAARAVLREAGAEIVSESGSASEFSATHVFGTARMGEDPKHSVVNAFGRTHDHPNLWIADASVFPGSGDGESPSLTIMSLALRTADAIHTQ
ncbi:GMC family oxidoreductase [Sinirhodobacter sp. WL0062]|uniref:GMC family oxidoreductase n=1 Tax=Rhodobacter flavimaris TaxID=2907145 RepID=A0ABS8YS72_9RHOB|nr:GMC family oxidoreductase [Sinirhodobacter sp. WL0062]MCE5972553.1 GMC family oxidoreductase [Sinirhodobacter sp. WL0062]